MILIIYGLGSSDEQSGKNFDNLDGESDSRADDLVEEDQGNESSIDAAGFAREKQFSKETKGRLILILNKLQEFIQRIFIQNLVTFLGFAYSRGGRKGRFILFVFLMHFHLPFPLPLSL
jgi:hypothetical protein